LKDLAIELSDRPGELARMGEALGQAGVSIEGGGAFVVSGKGVAHFLFVDGAAALAALDREGMKVNAVRDVVVQKLRQDEPGQLGKRKDGASAIVAEDRSEAAHVPMRNRVDR